MRYFIYLITLTLLSCSSHSDKSGNAVKIDTTQSKKEKDDSNFREEFILLYQKTTSIDTSFLDKGRKITVLFRHYSTMDNNLVVPSKYNFDTNKDFVTHNFVSDLMIITNKDTTSKTHITKAIFNLLLDSSLKKYATLLYPTLRLKNDSIQIHYSISIPVTDVGIGADIIFDKKGNYTMGQ